MGRDSGLEQRQRRFEPRLHPGLLAVRAVATRSPHLEAFVPGEGMTAYHRDVIFRGGIPDTDWAKLSGRNRPVITQAWPPPDNEDPPAPVDREEDDFLGDIVIIIWLGKLGYPDN
jgi:hypothetical protein